jgi:GDP-L-fucose synthase
MDANVITQSIKNQVTNFLYIGSSCMYPKDFRQPLVESDLLKAPLEPTNEGYALAKITGSKLCEYASRSKGLNYKTIIPSNLYGPGDNFDPLSSHLLASVIRKVDQAKDQGINSVEVWGAGLARREFSFIEDISSWVSHIIPDIGALPDYLNVGLGKDYTVNEFYEIASEVIGVSLILEHDESKPEGMKVKLLDSTLAKTGHGWNPETGIKDGINKTYEWYKQTKGHRK